MKHDSGEKSMIPDDISNLGDNHPVIEPVDSLVALARLYVELNEEVNEAYGRRRHAAKNFIAAMESAGREFPVSVRLSNGKLIQMTKEYSDSIKLTEPAEELA